MILLAPHLVELMLRQMDVIENSLDKFARVMPAKEP